MPELAVLGGRPVIPHSPLPHYQWPVLTERTEEAVLRQLRTSISIYNKSGIIDELEKRLCSYHGVKHALLTCTGTAGLHAAFVAASLREGDEVLCPAYTFYATATPLFFTGAIPVLIDCDINGNIDPRLIEEKITPKTKAILITHMWGIPCDMEPLLKIAKERGLLLIEDGSHAHGAEYQKKKIGSFGDLAVFSLQGQKTLTGGEGGFLLTPSDELYYRAVLMGHYNKRCLQEIPKDHPLHRFGVTGMGLKLRIHPLSAAIANEQLDSLDEILAQRREIAKKMISLFSKLPGISPPSIPSFIDPAWYAIVFQYNSEALGGLPLKEFHKAVVAEGCKELDLPTSTCPLNLLPLFQSPQALFPGYEGKVHYKPGDFPKAEKFYQNAFKLPVWHKPEDMQIVFQYFNAFEKVINYHKELLR